VLTWTVLAADFELPVRCGGEDHTIAWRCGRLHLVDHDLNAERIAAALGGSECECLQLFHRLTKPPVAEPGPPGRWWWDSSPAESRTFNTLRDYARYMRTDWLTPTPDDGFHDRVATRSEHRRPTGDLLTDALVETATAWARRNHFAWRPWGRVSVEVHRGRPDARGRVTRDELNLDAWIPSDWDTTVAAAGLAVVGDSPVLARLHPDVARGHERVFAVRWVSDVDCMFACPSPARVLRSSSRTWLWWEPPLPRESIRDRRPLPDELHHGHRRRSPADAEGLRAVG
jgi:hypothetical protein